MWWVFMYLWNYLSISNYKYFKFLYTFDVCDFIMALKPYPNFHSSKKVVI
jgi:hypothetical protein